MAPDSHVVLRWEGGQEYTGGRPGGPDILFDGRGAAGPSPVDGLLLSLASCMAIDVQMIVEKSRVPLEGIEMEITADRAESPPRRLTRVRMVFRLSGPAAGDEPKVRRAVELSRDTYCSVFHSLRPDIEIETEILLDGSG
jgi:putative redox protein